MKTLLLLALACGIASAQQKTEADNTLSAAEKKAGFELLFNGKDLKGWKSNNGKTLKGGIEDGAIQPYKTGARVVISERQFGNFVLRCDFKLSKPKTNSGIFLRVSDPKNPVQKGFEVQVMGGKGTGTHDLGAIYDLAPISKNMNKPIGEGNSIEITCKGPVISVKVNREAVSIVNLDDFKEPKKRPDGSKHKFGDVKNLPRTGHIGFQDHGSKVWFKNVRIKELK